MLQLTVLYLTSVVGQPWHTPQGGGQRDLQTEPDQAGSWGLHCATSTTETTHLKVAQADDVQLAGRHGRCTNTKSLMSKQTNI